MNLSSSTRAAVAVLEALYAQQDWLINSPNLSYEVEPETEVQHFEHPVLMGKTWRIFQVKVRQDGKPWAIFQITLYGEQHDQSWRRADIRMSPFGNMYRHFEFKASWTPRGWKTRTICLVASSHGYGALEMDSGLLHDGLWPMKRGKMFAPTPDPV